MHWFWNSIDEPITKIVRVEKAITLKELEQ